MKSKSQYEFGRFRLDAAERTLWRDGQTVPLTQKALETLAVLVERSGRLVEKEELLKAVWPDTFVEEGNLAVQISLLRKTLGDEGYIETVPRRGYRFVAAVRDTSPPDAVIRPPEPVPLWKRRWLLYSGAAAAGGALAAKWLVSRQPAGALNIRSMAVLPFQVLQPAPGDEPLGLGLADAVITRLGGMNKCIVRPTSAVRQFDQASRDPVAAGATLGVDAVLDASIQSAGGRIRMNAQLIDVKNGRHLWTDTIDVPRADLFTLEDELSARFARSLFGESLAGGRYRPKPEAHRLYTLGRYHRNRWNPEGQRKAIEYFEESVALDPGYAAAWAMMADSWSLLGYFFGMAPRETYPKAETAAQKALGLDERLGAAHHSLGAIRLFFDWKFGEAEQHLRRALELNPNDPDALQVFGVLRTVQKKNAEGVAALERSLAIDPASQWRHIGMSFQYACAGRIDAAIEESKKAHELDPELAAAMMDLFKYYALKGRAQDAVEWYLKMLRRPEDDASAAALLRLTFRKEGMRGFLRVVIAQGLEKARPGGTSPLAIAQLYSLLDNREEAVRWIEKAVDARLSAVIFINQQPVYAVLRGQAKFEEIVRRIGL